MQTQATATDVYDRLSSSFSRSGLSAQSNVSNNSAGDDDEPPSTANILGPETNARNIEAFSQHLSTQTKEAKKTWTEEEKDEMIGLSLQETETITLIHIPSLRVSDNSEEAAQVVQRNQAYQDLLQSHKSGGDSYIPRHSQTVNFATKNKDVHAVPDPTRDAGCVASSWAIDGAFLKVLVSACLRVVFGSGYSFPHLVCIVDCDRCNER